ncbi:hypothetical protein [Microbacterium sp. NPDC086615]|jgi:hypothetical protein|uniref:hypothetical protein n=2 Tax=unclassified Microbacterium TaxID=2609290 RepID=UPI00342FF7D8|nr:hypothetical protein [Microbacterium sp.]
MPLSRPLLAVPIALAAALLFTGCTGASSPDASGDGGATEQSPLTEYLSAVYGAGGSSEEQLAELGKKREELVAACMKKNGFEYTPDLQASATIVDGSGEAWKPDDRQWVSQWGYGAVAFPGSDDAENPSTTWVDPNADYLSTLSESEKQAFSDALWGTPPASTTDTAAEDETPTWDWKTAGCQGEAQHEVSGEDPLQTDQFAPLMNAITELWQQSSTYPGMSEANREWSACMDEAGHTGFATQPDAAASIHDQLNALWNAGGAASSEAPATPDKKALAELKDEEIDLALADLDCREKTDYTARARKAQAEAETAFIAAHKTELEALKAAAQAKK